MKERFAKTMYSAKALSVLLAAQIVCVSLFSGCAIDSKPTQNSLVNDSVVEESTIETDISSIETTPTTIETLPLESYTFAWEDDENYDFEQFIYEKYGIYLGDYIFTLGFTNELSVDFTNFVNNRFNTDYDIVPFKKANYFFNYIRNSSVRDYYDDYDIFRRLALNNNKNFTRGALDSKFIFSYLEQNNIPFGYPVPFENMKELVGEDVYTCDLTSKYYDDHEFGNYDDSYAYSGEEIVTLLKNYNSKVRSLACNKGIKTLTIEDNLDVCDVWNAHLIEYFGSDAPRFGQCLTKDQVIKLKGGYYDLSYIPGAVYDETT